MVISQMLFYVDGSRKVPLCSELDKHSIWMNTEVWKLTLQRVINLKFQEAVVNLEKQQKEQEEREKASKEKGLIGFFNKVKKIGEKPVEVAPIK